MLQPGQTAVALQRVTPQHQLQHRAVVAVADAAVAVVDAVAVAVAVAGRGDGDEVRPRVLQYTQVVVAQV